MQLIKKKAIASIQLSETMLLTRENMTLEVILTLSHVKRKQPHKGLLPSTPGDKCVATGRGPFLPISAKPNL